MRNVLLVHVRPCCHPINSGFAEHGLIQQPIGKRIGHHFVQLDQQFVPGGFCNRGMELAAQFSDRVDTSFSD